MIFYCLTPVIAPLKDIASGSTIVLVLFPSGIIAIMFKKDRIVSGVVPDMGMGLVVLIRNSFRCLEPVEIGHKNRVFSEKIGLHKNEITAIFCTWHIGVCH